ncbi:MAG: HDOD domain-containing protein [Candidatus Cloacimonetes bacterium]|nr:HDOD domain-containing protein [Candidatus Cloacimonadota bacterium]
MDNKTLFLNELLSLTIQNQGMFFTLNILTEYKKAISNPETSVGKIASIIEKDPGLTSSSLKMANSSFYGFSKSVHTVKQAISILGYKTLEKILLTQAMKTSFLSQKLPFMNELWKHSLTTAIASHQIALMINPILAEQAFIVGLLHDLGKFMLLCFKKDDMDKILKNIETNPHQYSINLEIEVFEIDHQEIGEFFAKQWLFPENVSNTIRYHHTIDADVSEIDRTLICIVAIANNIAKSMEFGKSTSGLVELLPHSVFNNISFKPNDFEKIVYTTKNKFYELISLMED